MVEADTVRVGVVLVKMIVPVRVTDWLVVMTVPMTVDREGVGSRGA